MKTYSIFNTLGKIIRILKCPSSVIDIQLKTGESYLEGLSNDETQYIPDTSNPLIVDKLDNPSIISSSNVVADGIDKIILSGTPIGSTISLGTVTLVSDGTDIDLIFDISGAYTLKVELFPYLPFEAEINAT